MDRKLLFAAVLAIAGCASTPPPMLTPDGHVNDKTFVQTCSVNIRSERKDLTQEQASTRCKCMYSLVKAQPVTGDLMDDAYGRCDAAATRRGM